MNIQPTRRSFLKGLTATGAALIIGFDASGELVSAKAAEMASGKNAMLNPFVKITPDGLITVILKHFEMGQGTTTGLTTLIAEEMDADWGKIQIEFAPADQEKYKNLAFGAQGTGGSTAIANSFTQYRLAGAGAKEIILQAAAAEWGVEPSAITIEKGVITAGDKSAHYGTFVAAAAKLPAIKAPKMKSPEQFTLIGKDFLPRKDNDGKTDGTAIFAMDVKVPNMVYAVIKRSPRFGGKLASFDINNAAKVKGFIDAKEMPNKTGIAIYAKSTYAAIKAREAIEAKWDFAEAENRSTDEIVAGHFEKLRAAPQFNARKEGDPEATKAALQQSGRTVTAEILLPLLAHAPMEPLNCVIEPKEDGGVTLYDGCQFPSLVQPTVAGILGLEPKQVTINTVYAGGSFGRRANHASDYTAEAAHAFKALGGKQAVKLVWTREDDLAGGFYRPMAAHGIKIGIDDNGEMTGWEHHIVCQSIMTGTPFEAGSVKDGVDESSVEGVNDTPYQLPNMAVGLTNWTSPMSVLWWRSVGHSHTGYAMEVAMDMAAKAADKDPLEFRLQFLGGDGKDQQRLAGVLKLVAEKAGWGKELPEGRYRGIAAHKSFNSYIAEVVEISDNDGEVKIERVTCAVDCGIPVNPDIIKAQMEGGIGYALGHIMRNEITLKDGVIQQGNFPDYEPLRIADIGTIDVHIVPSTEEPTGVGEPGVPPAGPALANAIMAMTGKPVLRLPMNQNGVEFV